MLADFRDIHIIDGIHDDLDAEGLPGLLQRHHDVVELLALRHVVIVIEGALLGAALVDGHRRGNEVVGLGLALAETTRNIYIYMLLL